MKPRIFCEIVGGDSPASVIYEGSDVMAILDIYPVQRGRGYLYRPGFNFLRWAGGLI